MQAAFFCFLPTGGAVRVAGHQLYNLRKRFDWHAYLPEGGVPLVPESGVLSTSYPFPAGKRLSGAARLAAPLLLWRKVYAYRKLCEHIGRDILASEDEVLLAHTSLIIASTPLLACPGPPSVYFCEEYPRYIYEKGMYKTGSAAGDMILAPLLAWEKKLDRHAAQSASVLVANSSFMAEKLQDVYKRKAVVVSPGVNTDFFAPSGVSRENFVLTVGALSEFKRHHLVVEALASIPESNRPAMITVADRGEEAYSQFLASLASRSGVKLVIERGVTDKRLVELYRTAKAVVCPQRNEPYGLVPLEAMACSAPVVAVNQGGFRENVIHGENGLLVEPDAASIAEALNDLFTSTDKYSAMGKAGREFVVAQRSVKVEAETVAGLMENAAGK